MLAMVPQPHPGFVHVYADEPGLKLCIVSKLGKFVKDLENSGLGPLFRGGFGTDDRVCLSINPALVRPHQLTKGVRIAVQDGADYCSLG